MYDGLAAVFGTKSIFQDLIPGKIPGGQDFENHIRQTIAESAFVLVLIGPGWLESSATATRPRLFDHAALVRREIEAALTGSCTTIPVCIAGAETPAPEQLPASIQSLLTRQVMHVRRGADFHRDMDELTARLSQHLAVAVRFEHT